MLEAEGQAELQRLQGTVDQVKDKLLNQWTGEPMQKYLDDVCKTHEDAIKKGQDNMEALGSAYSALQEQAKNSKQALQDKIDKLTVMKKNLEEMRIQSQKIMMETEDKCGVLKTHQQKNAREKELLHTQQEYTKSKLGELEKAAQYFTDRMSLDFKKLDSERIQVVFTNIDPDDASRQYSFTVKVTDGYEVTECEPQVEGLEEMVEKLNKTNHFSLFVINIRRKFREMVI
ncbi:kinetochore protein Spc25-like [Glandiceps talaboti]